MDIISRMAVGDCYHATLALNISFKLVMTRPLTNLYKSISLKNFQKVTVFQASQ